ncbi:oligoribonuclease [Trypanosoma rangeli]|uniref:Oligoribonuclease n=1 Tax=Trypanosoma rangeli TaxID=5698 RepID=A0A422NVG7_TRYRA|nr:oligoribonuclease [Trypanosoma rangeli]RNF09458.1 oligoribonuclease [Trypanosoma rangeli]|eukprot:RNF09458.1 oligoribonuclease [Trypanosoma rangeli]
MVGKSGRVGLTVSLQLSFSLLNNEMCSPVGAVLELKKKKSGPWRCADAMALPAPTVTHGTRISNFSYFMMVLALIAALLVAWLRQEERTLVGQTFLVKPKFVVDGSSFYATTEEGKLVLLRLRLLDAPALDGPYGRESRSYLSQLLLNRPAADVLCRVTGADAVAGLIADVFVPSGGSDSGRLMSVQEMMVRQGWAWAMQGGFAPNYKLRVIMAEARQAKRGLWQDERYRALLMHRAARGQKLSPSLHAEGHRRKHGSQNGPAFPRVQL